jgi:hypothetical protein
MASKLNRLCTTATRNSQCLRCQTTSRSAQQHIRSFHSTLRWREEEASPTGSEPRDRKLRWKSHDSSQHKEGSRGWRKAKIREQPIEEIPRFSKPDIPGDLKWTQRGLYATDTNVLGQALSRTLKDRIPEGPQILLDDSDDIPDFMAMGEENEEDEGGDEVFEGDDLSALGHGRLEQHREIREYMRIASWEMPLLTGLLLPIKYFFFL